MRTKFLLLIVVIAFAPMLRATDLRGRIDGKNQRPLAGVAVGLFLPQPNGSYALVRQAATGPDGVYYFKGVPQGSYVLQIAGVNYPLAVTVGPMQDIPVILK
jgi:hypothetical protein